MKKFIYLLISLFILWGLTFPMCLAQNGDDGEWNGAKTSDWNFNQSPTMVLEAVKHNANKYKSEQVQNTQYDNIQSNCGELWVDSRFTITRTLCNIKEHSKSYLQYVIFIWLTLATILIIRNWFKLVTSPDRWKEIKNFQKNIIYIVIGVALILSFYWILDIFVSLVNFVTE